MSKSEKSKSKSKTAKPLFNKNPIYCANNSWKKPKNGKTITSQINSDHKLISKKIQSIIDKGYTEIYTHKQLSRYEPRSYVSYITAEGLYRPGGFLRSVQPEYFALHGGTQQNSISFCVRFDDTSAIYVKGPKIKVVPTTSPVTKWPVKIADIVISYEKDAWHQSRKMQSKKYQLQVDYYNRKLKPKEIQKKVKEVNTSTRDKIIKPRNAQIGINEDEHEDNDEDLLLNKKYVKNQKKLRK